MTVGTVWKPPVAAEVMNSCTISRLYADNPEDMVRFLRCIFKRSRVDR